MAINVGTAMAYLDLDITAFNSALQGAQTGLNAFADNTESKFDSVMNKVQNFGGALTNLGSQLTQGITVPVISFGTSALDAYRDAETAFTGVKKTVDGTDEQFDKLNEEIKKLATSTASSYEEIAGVMEIAGQLGVPIDSIAEFSKVMTMLGDSTNLTSEQAAENLAKLMNITGTTWNEVENLGSSIVDLGNNFATQEDQIVLMSTRLASAGTMAGLSTQEILALATAMTSVGIRAEAGGTAMSTTIAQITQMIAEAGQGSEEATEKVKILENIMGVVPGSLQRLWKEDPMSVISAFINGLAQMDENGQETVTTLDALGMSGIRQSNMIRSLALANDQLNGAIDMSNEAWKENTALSNEAELRYGTLDSRISQLNERWKEMKRDVAELLIPILEQLMGIAERLINWWMQLDDSTKQLILKFVEIAAVAGPFLMILGKVISTGAVLIQTIGSIVRAVSGIGSGLKSLMGIVQTVHKINSNSVTESMGLVTKFGGTVTSVLKIFGGIGSILGGAWLAISSFLDMWNNGFSMAKEAVMLVGIALAGIGAVLLGAPAGITAIIAAIIAVVATAIIWLHDHWDEFCEFLKNLWNGFVEFWKNIWNGIVDFFKGIIEGIRNAWQTFKDWFGKIWDGFLEFWRGAWENIKEFFRGIVEGIKQIWETFKEWLGKIWSFIVDAWKASFEFVKDFIRVGVDTLKGFWETLQNFIGSMWNAVVDLWKKGWQLVWNFFQDIFQKIKDFFVNIWNTVKEFFNNIFSDFKNFFDKIKQAFQEFRENGLSGIGKFILDILKAFAEFALNLLKHLAQLIVDIVKAVVDFGVDLLKRIGQFLIDVVKAVINFVPEMIKAAGELIKGFIKGIIDWIPKAVETVKDFAKKVIDAAKDKLGIHSPSTVFAEIGENVDKGMAQGILNSEGEVTNAAVQVGTSTQNEMVTSMNRMVLMIRNEVEAIKSVLLNVISWFSSAGNDAASKFAEPMRSILNSVAANFNSLTNSMGNMLASLSSRATSIISNINGSHRSGLDFVPYDGYVAKLHQGERVLTKQEAQDYNNNIGGSGGDTYNFYNTKPDPYEYARQMKRVKRELQFG